jgi:hypothetical protein
VNLRQLVELIGTVSAHSPNLIETPRPLAHDAVQRFADSSQIRTRHWLAVLDHLPREIAAFPPGRRPLVWDRSEIVLVDVLAGGMVARVWGAVLTACDRSRRSVTAEKVARGVLACQTRAYERVLRMLVDGPHLTPDRTVRLDTLRRQMERWTDLLLGHLARRYAVVDFAYDLDRALDFGDEQARDCWRMRRNPIWELYFLCLRCGFPQRRLPGGILGIWRKNLFGSILGCFTPDLFEADGPLLSVPMKRLLSSGARPEGPARPGVRGGTKFAGCRKLGDNGLIDGKLRSGGCREVTE